jgi:glycosyltransferase involved in cell wall biosynthesis
MSITDSSVDGAQSVTGRARAVLICYASEPGEGSEEGVGWTWAVAAAEVADVVMFTNPVSAPIVQRAADELGLPIVVSGVEPPQVFRSIATRRWGGFVYYLLWQVSVARALRRLERDGRVDVVHHLTWGSDSLPTPLLASRAPVRIWGPVGGSTRTIGGLYRFLNGRSRVDEVIRDVVNTSFRRVSADRVARHASLVVAMNRDVQERFARSGTPILVEPNCALETDELMGGSVDLGRRDGQRVAVFVGRLLGWKGPHLAIESLVHAPDWRLVVMGDGPERDRVLARAQRLGVADRVEMRGVVPRSEVLAAFRSADALLFPSFHDSASWAVAEASALGCPVVCLDAGGPPLVAGRNAHIVERQPTGSLPHRIGAALEALDGRGELEDRWNAKRLPALVAEWYGLERTTHPAAHQTHDSETAP